MRDLESVLADLRRIAPDIKARYGLTELAVFGSYARGEQREDSDLDVLVELGRPMGMIEFATLREELSDDLHLPVDLVTRQALKAVVARSMAGAIITL